MRQLHPNLVPWLQQYNAFVAKLRADGVSMNTISVREALANLTKANIITFPQVALVKDVFAPTPEYRVPVRIYNPQPSQALPVLLYFHGGGHIAGSVSVYDPICRRLARATNHIVVAPEYRLGPENPYPAGILDCYNVLLYVWETLDHAKMKYQRRLSLGGDSAGGAITAIMSSKAQYDKSIQIHKQFLLYPCLDYTMNTHSSVENATGYFLESPEIPWYYAYYFMHGENFKEVSPLFWDVTPRIPNTLVMTSEFCPLRDEGIKYVEKLRAANLPVQHIHFENMIHCFINLEKVVPDACQKFYDSVAAFLKD